MTGQLEALPFAAGQSGEGLPERQISQTDGPQVPEPCRDVRIGGKQFPGPFDSQIQNIGDAVVAVVSQSQFDGKRLIGIAFASAFRTRQSEDLAR